ncbi:glycosyltransferase [Rheinheimera sp. UJ51]|uniref:glycosyltransferase family 2 protein n=1 Tax=Rheinheimera sp. UJ51 TaxID=2892446 RepID=UPI001E30CFFC|nr:glycosyltransferase [Rheinheimera sp. UJ51]MCC5450495.1 glycosyltransferase [Rheinheimera sp. UJ51]
MPQITALMTTFNSAAYVQETLESILNQSFSNFEFLILDDGSTDNTVDVIKNIDDNRIRLIENQENRGVGYRLNQALSLLNDTRYIAKVDSDDVSALDRFKTQYDFIEKNSHIAAVKSYVEYFADTDSVAMSERFSLIKHNKEAEINAVNSVDLIDQQLRRWLCIPHTTYMAHTSVVKKIGYPNSRMYEDYSFFYRMLLQGYKIGCVCKPLVRMRISESSTTANSIESYLDTGLNVIVDFKFIQIRKLLQKNQLFIYGSGQLARSLCRVLQRRGIAVEALLERYLAPPVVLSSGLEIPVKLVSEAMPDKSQAAIIIAAQPVRAEICDLIKRAGWEEWQDFLVIA